jgi:hypothetical protein
MFFRLKQICLNVFQVETKDALLHAINEEFVEAVEVLLEHEETIHKEGEPHVSKTHDSKKLNSIH